MSKYELNFKREILGELISDTIGKLKLLEGEYTGKEKNINIENVPNEEKSSYENNISSGDRLYYIDRISQYIDYCYEIRQDRMFEVDNMADLDTLEKNVLEIRKCI